MSEYNVNVHIGEAPILPDSTEPHIIFGFTGPGFSQAVFMPAPLDPAEALVVADQFYKSYIEACGKAVQAWKTRFAAEPESDESYNATHDETITDIPETA